MSTARLAGIPVDHVAAELAAFPLASENALSNHPVTLDPQLSGATGRLWRAAENDLIESLPSFSLDELVALRDRIWFAERGRIPLHRYLRQLAGWFLEVNGPVAIPRLPVNEQMSGSRNHSHTAIARRAWLWLTFALPPDLLLAGLDRSGSGPVRIELMSPPLAQLLRDRGYAETHLHVGAALDFPLLWNLLLHTLASSMFRHDAFRSPGAVLGEGAQLAAWLVRAAIGRYLLAAFLSCPSRPADLREFLLGEFYRRIGARLGAGNYSRLLLAVSELETGRMATGAESFAVLKSIYARLTGVQDARVPTRLTDAMQADPLAPLVADHTSRSPEVKFVARALRFLESSPQQRDSSFSVLFWQIVRVRTLFYRHVVQRPMTPGLQWFVRFYGRSRPARDGLPLETLLESALSLGGGGHGLRSLEIRTSPSAAFAENQQWVNDVDEFCRRQARPSPRHAGPRQESHVIEMGAVLHFIKRREGGADEGLPSAHWSGSNADPRMGQGRMRTRGNPTGYRYARFFRRRREEARSLAALLFRRPLALQVVRGIDVCTDELGVPNWVMAPLLERVRRAAASGASVLQERLGWAPPPLRTTVHAGEDFVHLLTGLRHVDEAIEQFGLREGDRIGHGLALGVAPREWANRAGRIAMTREERLWDLLWEWHCQSQPGNLPIPGRREIVGREIAELSENVFGRAYPPYELTSLRRSLGDAAALSGVGFPDGPPPRRNHRQRLLIEYLTDSGVFDRGREVIWVDPGNEGDALAAMQAALRRKIGSRGLVIEINPTSNLLIGDLGDLTSHPLWRLRPPRDGGDAPPVSICVGSDDPLVFGSNLRQEYQFLGDALALAGLSDEEAREWLERTRACGMESRFTIPCRPAPPMLDLFNAAELQPTLL